jgi:hypothetical protein
VKVFDTTWTIKSDELWLDVERRAARAEGMLLIEQPSGAVAADSGDFDYEHRRALLKHPRAGQGDWRFEAREGDLKEKSQSFNGADFTGCAEHPPHYHFHASHVRVVPKKYLLAYNSFFFIGKVPVFYTPILFKSLSKTHFLRWRLQPGYDRRNGGFVKSTLLTQHGPTLYSKLFVDYYTGQGLGTGAELQHRRNEDGRGAIYGYRIRENQSTHRERWAILGDTYQTLTSSFALQGRLQIQSDADFNNNYARSSLFRVTPELINSGALVYRLPWVTSRLAYARTDQDDGSHNRFLKTRESTPRFEFQTAALKGRLPFLNTFSGFAENNFDRFRDFQQRSAGLQWEGARTFIPLRGVSLTPKVGYGQTYFSRYDQPNSFRSTTTVLDAAVGKYLLEGNVRFASPVGDWDVNHRYERRQKAGSMADDAGALDYGVETNLTTLQDTLRPNRRVLVRVASGWDSRDFRTRKPGFRERVQPLVSEVVYTPPGDFNFSLRHDYQLQEGHRSLIGAVQWGELDASHVGAAVSFNKGQPHSTFFTNEFGYSPSTDSWRISAVLRSEVFSEGGLEHVTAFRLFEKEILFAKTFHDFFARVMVRFRPGGVKEGFLRVDMRLPTLDQPIARKDWESEWFPERARSMEDRP